MQYIVFNLDERAYALRLPAVERVVRAVEVTPLLKGNDSAFGVVNVQGRIIPAINIRKLFGLPEREIELNHQFIIANTSTRTVALVVDAVSDVIECIEQEVVPAEEILSELGCVDALIKQKDGMILVLNPDSFSISSEVKMLNET